MEDGKSYTQTDLELLVDSGSGLVLWEPDPEKSGKDIIHFCTLPTGECSTGIAASALLCRAAQCQKHWRKSHDVWYRQQGRGSTKAAESVACTRMGLGNNFTKQNGQGRKRLPISNSTGGQCAIADMPENELHQRREHEKQWVGIMLETLQLLQKLDPGGAYVFTHHPRFC
jgi:hypothetical protein